MSQRAHGDENGVRRLAWEHLDVDGRVEALGDKVDALIFDQRLMVVHLGENTKLVRDLDDRVEALATDALRELGAISRKLAEVADDNAAARKLQDSIHDEHETDITGVHKVLDGLTKSDEDLHAQVQAARRAARVKVGALVAVALLTWEATKWALPLLHRIFP